MGTRKLIVRELRKLTSGEADGGRRWTLYAIAATTTAGEPIRQELRSFERLPVGEVLELDVEPRPGRGGQTYTLRRRRRRDGRLQEQLEEQQRMIAGLARRLTLLEGRQPDSSTPI